MYRGAKPRVDKLMFAAPASRAPGAVFFLDCRKTRCKNRVGSAAFAGYSLRMSSNERTGAESRMPDADENYARVERAIRFLRAHHAEQPELRDIAAHIGLSESRTQRLFSRWAGISPKRFLQFLTVEHVKRRMGQTADLMGLSLDAGLSSPSRLHDLFLSMEAMSPGEFKRAAAGMVIRYGIGETHFGHALIASTARGICHLSFIDPQEKKLAVTALRQAWPEACLEEDASGCAALLTRVFTPPSVDHARFSLWVSGTNFQIQVWRALLQLPFAGLLSYQQLAGLLGRPSAARAVGSAVARNRIAYLIPCHRVLRSSGEFGVYHWGNIRKAAICGWEAANTHTNKT